MGVGLANGFAGSSRIKGIPNAIDIAVFFEMDTSTLSYVVYDEVSRDAVVIDSILDYDAAGCVAAEKSVGLLIDLIRTKNLNLKMILETHAHADHLSGAQVLKREFPQAIITIGERVREVQKLFRDIYGFESWFTADGSQFDHLVGDGESFKIGTMEFRALQTPGHTPACSTWILNGVAAFTGDALFIPDSGTGRCDFPGGSAHDLYDSITKRIYTLPDATRLFVGHDYQPGGRPLQWETTVAEAKSSNTQLNSTTSRQQYIEFRLARDKTLAAPRLLHPSIQVNINAGNIPPADNHSRIFLKMPVRVAGRDA